MRLRLQIAETHADVLRCRYLIAEVYNRQYEIVFSDDAYDLDAKVEPWPHRYVMISIGDDLVASAGLYLRQTYVERFGNVSDEEIQALIDAAGAAPRFTATRKREITKLSVHPDRRGLGLGLVLMGCAHARAFVQVESKPEEPHAIVCCSRASIREGVWHRVGIRTRPIKPFPIYKVHELYSSPEDPMDSRLVLPELDVPPGWYDLRIPGEYELDQLRAIR